MKNRLITIITPTTGKVSLYNLINSLNNQTVPFVHILLWDDKREDAFLYPDPSTLKTESPFGTNLANDNLSRYSIVIPGSFVQGDAFGSALRAVGMMAANTPYITFADDDVWFEGNHLETMLKSLEGHEWGYCKRKVWKKSEKGVEYIGVDEFESVGDSPDRKVPYEMVDNSCMIFTRRFGASAACLYRETRTYNDDRLMYSFLKQYAGQPGKTNLATVNQICPKRLEPMFEGLCSKL